MIARFTWQWLLVLSATLLCLLFKDQLPYLFVFPETWQLPIDDWLNQLMNGFLGAFDGLFQRFFRGIAWLLSFPVAWISDLLQWLPWPVMIVLVAVTAHRASGWPLVIFSVVAMLYMVVSGYWDKSMNSLALVALSVPIAIIIGFFLGVWGFFSARGERIILPLLDLLQTIPAFAYLLPIILLFGFGPVVGLIASVMYAVSPMVRNTLVGLREVPSDIMESAAMSGATARQQFFMARLPSARQQILLGINQTTMAALSMVIIAAIIGGTSDIGWEVLSTIRKALFGESLLAGLVIALIAMLMDRITAGLANRVQDYAEPKQALWQRYPYTMLAVALTLVFWLAGLVMPWLADYPEDWILSFAQPLNDGISHVVVQWHGAIKSIKTFAFFYLLLPVKTGLAKTISPYSWGFALTTWHIAGYVIAIALLSVWLWLRKQAGLMVFVLLLGLILYFGLTNMPWLGMVAMVGLLGWQLNGWRLACGVMLGLAYLLLGGVWPEAVISIYLCSLAVLFCLLFGGLLGVLMSQSERFSAFMRPINDTLQTMPLFVLLIPAVMIFKLGDFTALIAIVLYAIVPMIRYTEHGLRNLPKEVVEASESMGATTLQMLFKVKVPMAMPTIMLGLNQTILYGVAMLVITALVGTSDLGQRVYIGLGDGDFGVGMVAGIGMAILAIIADRLIQATVRRQQANA